MRLLPLIALVGASIASPLPLHGRSGRDQPYNETADVLTALQQANLTALADFYDANPSVLEQVVDSPGLKTILAPTNEAMAAIPSWCTMDQACFEGTMLMHILNGSFAANLLEAQPMHSVGHSFLTDARYVNLPGGNGQAVAMSQAGNYASEESGRRRRDDDSGLVGRPILASGNRPTSHINEALNDDSFVKAHSQDRSGSFTIQPIRRAMTVPGRASSTLKLLSNYSAFAQLMESQSDDLSSAIDDMRGVTIFAPSNEAIERLKQANPSQQAVQAIVRNHIVAGRAVYSKLLEGQGSMVTMGGQDLVFEQSNGTITVGQDKARVVQYDIVHHGGVIHTIDAVLGSEESDPARAQQAFDSASASANSFVAGPVSAQNAASSQGKDVPASLPGALRANVNSTITPFDATSNGSNKSDPSSTPPTASSAASDGPLASMSVLVASLLSAVVVLTL